MNLTMRTKILAFLPAIILLGFYVAGQTISQTSAQQVQREAIVEQAEAPVLTKPVEVTPAPEAPVTEPTEQPQPKAPCDTNKDPYCMGVHAIGYSGTPIPTVHEVQKKQGWVRSDGMFNYCYKMDDGSWTTVIGQLELSSSVYYYNGPIDSATEAPAYAVESQQWCKDNSAQ